MGIYTGSFGYAFGLHPRVNAIAFVSVVRLDGQLCLRAESLAATARPTFGESKTLTGSLLGDSSSKITYSLLEVKLSHEFSL